MEENEYSRGVAMTLLPEDYEYHFLNVEDISYIYEQRDVKLEFTTQVNVTSDNLKKFLEDI